jgi:hypothetical protein
MNGVTYTQVQELVTRLPAKNLPVAYDFLSRLADEEPPVPSSQVRFLSLPLAERRLLLAQQAEDLLAQDYYEETAVEREKWQGGDFVEY